MTILAADEADLAVLGLFGRRLQDAPEDPRTEWRRIARPDQLMPVEPFRVLYFQGGRGCIAPWTRIWLPLEERHERVDVLAAAGRPVTVLALTANGPRPALTDGAPFAKGIADLYEVTTEDGRTVTVTAGHRFLTPRGWRRLADVREGQLLASGAPAPPGGVSPRTRIRTIRHAGIGVFYDLTVPGPANYLAEGLWHHNSGKTRSGAQCLAEIILSDTEPDGQFGVIGPTYRDAWTVQIEGESGLLRALGTTAGEVKHGTSRMVEYAHRSYGEIGLRSGHVVFVDSADDGAIRVQGKNLRSAWCGEIGLWTRWATAFDESVKYAVRKGDSKIICDGTPKVSRPARALIRRLIRGDEPGTIVRRLRTIDNAANLSDAFYRSVIGAAKGTRLERQELEGELLDDVENALWSRELLERIQVPPFGQPGGPDYLWQAKVGVDPSDGSEDSDEQAYTVIGKGAPDDQHLYVAENWGGQQAPAPFARRCILVAVRYQAELVVEKNHGGEWLRATFAQVMKELVKEGRIPEGRCPRVRLVHASQAKRTRAEPVSAMYERDVVRHCKMASRDLRGGLDVRSMVELEDQMVTFTGSQGERSPDRLDSLTWGATPFLNTSFGPPGQGGIRKWAGSRELSDVAATEDAQMRRRLRAAHGGAYNQQTPDGAPWDLDGFGPQDDDQQHPENGRRGNVRAWR